MSWVLRTPSSWTCGLGLKERLGVGSDVVSLEQGREGESRNSLTRKTVHGQSAVMSGCVVSEAWEPAGVVHPQGLTMTMNPGVGEAPSSQGGEMCLLGTGSN